MSAIPTDDEIPLYVNDLGRVTCHVTGCDWDPSQAAMGRRTNLAELHDAIRNHAIYEHTNELGR